MKNVRINEESKESGTKLRVCGYMRVGKHSHGHEDSLENQTAAYKNLIESNPDYEFVGIYADLGFSGCMDDRPALQMMIRNARSGYIDIIITQSVSRISRNIKTALSFAEEMEALGVGILFEEPKINTLSGIGKNMIAALTPFAQEA